MRIKGQVIVNFFYRP